MTNSPSGSPASDATTDNAKVGGGAEEFVEPAHESTELTEPTEGAGKDDEDDEDDEGSASEDTRKATRGFSRARVLAYGVLPGLAVVLAMAAGFLKWQDSWVRAADQNRIESVQAARDSTVALLSYRAETVEQDLGAARDRLTGQFKDSYTSLIRDLVIPGAKQKQISAVATVPAAASVSAGLNHAVVLVFVNQTTTIGTSVPTNTASSVRVTLDKIDGRWLISGFDPV